MILKCENVLPNRMFFKNEVVYEWTKQKKRETLKWFFLYTATERRFKKPTETNMRLHWMKSVKLVKRNQNQMFVFEIKLNKTDGKKRELM